MIHRLLGMLLKPFQCLVLGAVLLMPIGFANISEGEPALVVLSASWCAKCRELPEIVDGTLQELNSENLRVVTLDVDNPSTAEVASRYDITLNGNDVPQVYLFSGSKTILLMSASEQKIGHTEESQAHLIQALRRQGIQ